MNNFDLTAFDRQELTQTVQKKLTAFLQVEGRKLI